MLLVLSTIWHCLSTLVLQVSEAELEAIAKGGGEVAMDVDVDGAGGEATRRLLGNYQTPARSGNPIELCI